MQERLLEFINENKIAVGITAALIIAIPTGIWIFNVKKKSASEYTWYRMSQISEELLAAEQSNTPLNEVLSETITAYTEIKTNQFTTDATPWLLLQLGNAQYDARKFDDAIETYREFIKKYPHHSAVPLARLSLGYACEENGMIQEALQQFREIGELKASASGGPGDLLLTQPFKTQRALDMGRYYEKLGAIEDARKAYNEVIGLSPNSDAARLAQYRLENLK